MKESLEATLKDVELTKEVYRLYTLEHQLLPSFCFLRFQRGCLSMQERCLGYLEVPECQLALICT